MCASLRDRSWGGGLLWAGLIWAPTLIMTLWVTPAAIINISLLFSAATAQRDVLQEMARDSDDAGDYSAASQALELMAHQRLPEDQIADAAAVRTKVGDLVKLAEMKWRYRVVDEGESPRDRAIELLEEAKGYIEKHTAKPPAGSSSEEYVQSAWAAELSEVCQGIALTKLIFNSERTEDASIEELLRRALQVCAPGRGPVGGWRPGGRHGGGRVAEGVTEGATERAPRDATEGVLWRAPGRVE
eukprot:4547893-Prymnesium_polylepis.1